MPKELTGEFEYGGITYGFREPSVGVLLEASGMPELDGALHQLRYCLTSEYQESGIHDMPISQFKGLAAAFAAALEQALENDPLLTAPRR